MNPHKTEEELSREIDKNVKFLKVSLTLCCATATAAATLLIIGLLFI